MGMRDKGMGCGEMRQEKGADGNGNEEMRQERRVAESEGGWGHGEREGKWGWESVNGDEGKGMGCGEKATRERS